MKQNSKRYVASERSKVKLFAPGIEMDWEFYHRRRGGFEAVGGGLGKRMILRLMQQARVALLRGADECVRPYTR